MTTHLLGVPVVLRVNSDLPVSEEPLQGIAVAGSSMANSFEVRPGVLSSETAHYNCYNNRTHVFHDTMNQAMPAVKVPFEEGEEENGVPPTDWLGSEPCAVE